MDALTAANQVLSSLAIVMPMLIGAGLLNKYLPFLRNVSNQLTPWFNTAIAFLALFGATPAHASLLGDVGHVFSFPAKITASFLISYLTSKLYDKFGDPHLPPGPQPTWKS